MTTATLFNDVQVAEAYADHRGIVDDAFVDEVARAIGPRTGRVADIGAGTGTPAGALRRRGFDVVAFEPSPSMIAQGRSREAGVAFVQAVGEDIPLGDATCAAVTMLYVLHHTEDPEAVLAEARRVVVPGGRVVVASGTEGCARQRLFSGYFPTLAPDLPDAEELALYGRAAGLTVAEVRTVDHWIYPQRSLDERYVKMVETEMFATLRSLNAVEFTDGLDGLRADIGRPLPPAQVSLLTLTR